MKKILVTGGTGQLGSDVVQELIRREKQVEAPDSVRMDITDYDAVSRIFERFRPEAVVHCAAWTNVDGAEEHPAKAALVNVEGTRNLAKLCSKYAAKMMYISTDYVFDGSGRNFWKPEDECMPLNVYGRTKYEGEQAVRRALKEYFIVRTSWVFGSCGENFVNTMLEAAKRNKRLKVVCDQTGSPAYTRDLASLIADMIDTEKYGTYHAANRGICSRYEFAKEIFAQTEILGHEEYSRKRLTVEPVSTKDYISPAIRPLNSRLDMEKLEENGFTGLPDWQDALRRYLEETGM